MKTKSLKTHARQTDEHRTLQIKILEVIEEHLNLLQSSEGLPFKNGLFQNILSIDSQKVLEQKIEKLSAENKVLKEQCEALNERIFSSQTLHSKELQSRFEEIAILTKYLLEAERSQRPARDRLTSTRTGSAAGRAIGKIILRTIELPRVWGILSQNQQLKLQCGRLLRSGLFDPNWYLEQNPDVAKSGMNPAKHYLLHGASEGRNPSPDLLDV